MYKKLFLFLLLSFLSPIFADYASHSSMIALKNYIAQEKHDAQNILIIFDLDNTIIHPKTEVGSDQWLEYQAKKHAVNGVSIAQAYDTLLPLYFKIQHLIELQLAEHCIADLISELQNGGISIIGLTARSEQIADRTISQLERLNVLFSSLAP